MEKIIRTLIVGVVLAAASLIGFGWKAYGKFDTMGKEIKKEVKEEMLEVRNRDMDYLEKRFNTVEKLMVGKVITQESYHKVEAEE